MLFTQKISKRRVVVRHQIIDDRLPERQTRDGHLEEGRIEQQIQDVLAPGFPRVLISGERTQQLRAGSERGNVLRSANQSSVLKKHRGI